MTIQQTEFRQVLGSFATGVTIMTCQSAKNIKGGMTVNSFASLSLDPPLILWSIDKNSDQFGAFETASHFAVNILSEGQEALSNTFAAPGADKFNGIIHEDGEVGAPILRGVCAILECRIKDRYEGGDHIILTGEVLSGESFCKRPLLFLNGQYAKIQLDN